MYANDLYRKQITHRIPVANSKGFQGNYPPEVCVEHFDKLTLLKSPDVQIFSEIQNTNPLITTNG